MKNQEKDLKNENSDNTERKLTKEERLYFMSKSEETRAEIRSI